MADHRPIRPANHRRPSDVPAPTAAGFAALGVPAGLVAALGSAGIREPFPIQTATLPDALAGRDILGRGRTGSGKTLAFVIPVLARLSSSAGPGTRRHPRVLVLAPTRELARQILEVIEPLASTLGLTATTVFGGVPTRPQITALRRGVDILVACPGRLEDLLRSGACRLGDVDITVLDEADHMADLGFLPAVRRILDQTPADGQRLLFSATLDDAVDVLVKRYLTDPVVHALDDQSTPAVEMAHHVIHITAADRLRVLVDLTSTPGRKLVFTRTKHRARLLTRQLVAAGIPAVEMHSNLTQSARVRNLEQFSSGRANVLVATDIAARGLHVDDVELVIHADPPLEHKTYLHRSGRTARAGAEGTVVTLATENQRADVAKLARRAGITPLVTRRTDGRPNVRNVPSDSGIVPEHAARRSASDPKVRESSMSTNRPKRKRRGPGSQIKRATRDTRPGRA
jgi:superfamily II DNA/RNA helicase